MDSMHLDPTCNLAPSQAIVLGVAGFTRVLLMTRRSIISHTRPIYIPPPHSSLFRAWDSPSTPLPHSLTSPSMALTPPHPQELPSSPNPPTSTPHPLPSIQPTNHLNQPPPSRSASVHRTPCEPAPTISESANCGRGALVDGLGFGDVGCAAATYRTLWLCPWLWGGRLTLDAGVGACATSGRARRSGAGMRVGALLVVPNGWGSPVPSGGGRVW